MMPPFCCSPESITATINREISDLANIRLYGKSWYNRAEFTALADDVALAQRNTIDRVAINSECVRYPIESFEGEIVS